MVCRTGACRVTAHGCPTLKLRLAGLLTIALGQAELDTHHTVMGENRTAIAGLAQIEARIADACAGSGRSRDSVQLIAVTKTQEPTVLAELAAAGVLDYGENRTGHLELMAARRPPQGRFHYIGRVQSRQFSDVVAHCDTLHSLADLSHVSKLAKACLRSSRQLAVYVQIDVAGEDQKAGISPEQLPLILDQLAKHDDVLTVAGLMCMAPSLETTAFTADDVRRCFVQTRSLAQKYGLSGLSMGMSQDFELAIQEGATAIRIGSALYASSQSSGQEA